VDVPVEFALPSGERRTGICRNISLGGMHIDAAQPADFGTTLDIFINLPEIEDVVSLTGVVRWIEPGGMGVQLGLFGARVTHAIIRLLTES
jgi:type IV pilus assembly protein PilZ